MTSVPATIAVAAITGYQRYISPHKGFVCAHKKRNGGLSCSAYAKFCVLRYGLLVGWRKMQERFQSCAVAAQEEKDSKQEEKKKSMHPAEQAYWCTEGGCLACSLMSWLG